MNSLEIFNYSRLKYQIQQKRYEWCSVLDILAEKKPKKVLEIGCYDGGTTYSFSHFCETLVTIDDNNPCRFSHDEIKSKCKYDLIIGNSHLEDTFNKVTNISSDYDCLFIDGDHSYEGTLQDYTMYSKLVNPNGLIIFHDVVDSPYHRQAGCYASRAWLEVRGANYKEFICTDASIENGIINHDVCVPCELNDPRPTWGGIGVKLV